MIGIIDYGSGNLRSVYNAFRFLGQDAKICGSPAEMEGSDKIVLPGVGSSKDALEGLKERRLIEPVLSHIEGGKPFLGICLGLQLLFERSEESGGCDCLGLIKGEVRIFPGQKGLKVPQIGWNTVKVRKKDCPILKGLSDESYFYFVHSYYCDTAEAEYTAGETEYGVSYTSILWKDNVFAMQFHPERSQKNGMQILKNFTEL
jgi:glutamine amidotransferase